MSWKARILANVASVNPKDSLGLTEAIGASRRLKRSLSDNVSFFHVYKYNTRVLLPITLK